jgi:hypothetical protein
MKECQISGFRLIKRCITKDPKTSVVVEDKYINDSCPVFDGSAEEFILFESDKRN